jgi:hypothetical protein
MPVLYVLVCVCGARLPGEPQPTIDTARKVAKSHGWTNPRRGADLCRSCTDAAKAAKRATGGYF